MLETFMSHAGQVLSPEQLVDVYVGHLRKKVGSDRIKTVRGAGYRFEA